jgi:hypothetical protein
VLGFNFVGGVHDSNLFTFHLGEMKTKINNIVVSLLKYNCSNMMSLGATKSCTCRGCNIG